MHTTTSGSSTSIHRRHFRASLVRIGKNPGNSRIYRRLIRAEAIPVTFRSGLTAAPVGLNPSHLLFSVRLRIAYLRDLGSKRKGRRREFDVDYRLSGRRMGRIRACERANANHRTKGSGFKRPPSINLFVSCLPPSIPPSFIGGSALTRMTAACIARNSHVIRRQAGRQTTGSANIWSAVKVFMSRAICGRRRLEA